MEKLYGDSIHGEKPKSEWGPNMSKEEAEGRTKEALQLIKEGKLSPRDSRNVIEISCSSDPGYPPATQQEHDNEWPLYGTPNIVANVTEGEKDGETRQIQKSPDTIN